VVVYNASSLTYLTALQITSSHLEEPAAPELAIGWESQALMISWPTSATGFELEATATLGAGGWSVVEGSVVEEGGFRKVTVTPDTAGRFFRLARP
jgi:hypothetical protein